MRAFFFCLGVLLIGTATGDSTDAVNAEKVGEKLKLTCKNGLWKHNDEEWNDTVTLEYKDDSSGEYECYKKTDDDDTETLLGTYYVKFRTCENCIELDLSALMGIIMGNVVATILIIIAVYFISTQSKGPSFPINKASQESDRRNLIQNDSTYQPLSNSGRDAYEVLHTKRR